MSIPNASYNSSVEDIQNIENDIQKLYNRFILPIEVLRSIAEPFPIENSKDYVENMVSLFNSLQVNNHEALESRCDAFYRMLGFPVVSNDGSYYNPGFNPNQALNSKKYLSINEKVNKDQDIQSMLAARRDIPRQLKDIFKRQGTISALYAYALTYNKKFNLLNESIEPLKQDTQSFSVDVRSRWIELFKQQNPNMIEAVENAQSYFKNTILGYSLTGGKHILKPFVVNANIDITVTPYSNRICVPFLKSKKDTQVEENLYLNRPGIELIIRERLRDVSSVSDDFAKSFSAIKNPTNSDKKLNINIDYVDVVYALSGSEVGSSSLIGFTDVQAQNTSMLIKTIKAVLSRLISAQKDIEDASRFIHWFPLPSIKGPAVGAREGAELYTQGIDLSSGLNYRITEMKIKKLVSEIQQTSENNSELGDFASPFTIQVGGEKVDDNNKELDSLIAKRNQLAAKAFKAMSDIEIITGEVSGLGLLDVLAIYTALWAIDIEDLLNFLDDDAFQRLKDNNPDLLPELYSSRNNTGESRIISTLKNFEIYLSNILNFADNILDKSSSTRFKPGQI